MQAFVETVRKQLDTEFGAKTSLNVHGDDVEHWIKIEKDSYKSCLYFEKMWDEGDYSRTAVTFYDNQRPLADFDDVYTNDDIDEGLPLIINRISTFIG
jgi:hypothetical protein